MIIGAMNHPGRDPVEEISWIGRHGFDFVDLTLEPPGADPERIDVPGVCAALQQHDLKVVAHTAYYLPIGSPFGSVRAACLAEFRRALQTATAVGATVMNTHFSRSPPFFSNEQTTRWHAEVLGPLCEEAAESGMAIVIEHVPGPFGQLEIIEDLLQRLPQLRFHLDSGHAKLEGKEDRWSEYLARLGHKLAHVHLSENDGSSDQHLPLASAPFSKTNWPVHVAQLKQIGYDGTITLEVFSPDRRHLTLSRNLLRQWWDAAPVHGGAAAQQQ